jgi:hypothetical protein
VERMNRIGSGSPSSQRMIHPVRPLSLRFSVWSHNSSS